MGWWVFPTEISEASPAMVQDGIRTLPRASWQGGMGRMRCEKGPVMGEIKLLVGDT
jgi:hypothetical protein